MDRKTFIKCTCLAIGPILIMGHIAGCEDSSTDTPVKVDFYINLDDPKYSSLKNNGSFVIVNDILIARTLEGTYVAVSSKCTHEGKQITFRPANNDFHCPSHDSVFSLQGKRMSGPAKKDLVQYRVEVNGNIIRIFS